MQQVSSRSEPAECLDVWPGTAHRSMASRGFLPEVRSLLYARSARSAFHLPGMRASIQVLMSDITVSAQHHGSDGDRRYTYEPTFIMRGLSELHITFTPVG